MRLGLQLRALNSLLRLWLIFAAVSVAAQTSAKAASSAYSITGTVVSSGTGAPVAHCHITATHSDRGSGTNKRGGFAAECD